MSNLQVGIGGSIQYNEGRLANRDTFGHKLTFAARALVMQNICDC